MSAFLPLERLAAKNNCAGSGSGTAWRLDRDLHGGEVIRVGGAGHGEGPAAAIWDEKRTSRSHLATPSADVPAFIPLRILEVPQVMHGQGNIPAAGGILTSHRSPRGCCEAAQLGRCGDMK